MITLRPADQRGYADHRWLNSHHTFSFAAYHDPRHTGFRNLRVMNEDRVAPAHGFGTHPHDNMEIVSYVLAGSLEHEDSMGHRQTLTPGEFQRISAGSGITHSELNPSPDHPTHFYQVWLRPHTRDIAPSYEQKRFDPTDTHTLPPNRHAWLQVLRGSVTLNDSPMHAADGATVTDETQLAITATRDAELMLFDLN
ncbi:MAG: pirin family protein [Desulfobacterales bacterium]|nr:pirin family protein [Desulfobacterales bacterium]